MALSFSIDKQDLQGALNQLGRVTPTRSTLPVLSCVLMSAEGAELTFRASDLEITQVIRLPASVSGEGGIAVPFRMFADIVGEMPEGEIKVDISGEGNINLVTEFGKYSIMGRSASEFPSLPNIDGNISYTLPASRLEAIIDKTAFAVSKDELKPSLQGVLFQFRESDFRAVSTDGHRLSRVIISETAEAMPQGEYIIPAKFLSVLSTYLEGDNEDITLEVGENHIMLHRKETTLYSRLIDERYPDYESVFPTENNKRLVIGKDELLSAVKRVSILSNRSTRQIALHLSANDAIDITTEDVETVTSARESVPAKFEGEALSIGYNSHYVRDVLSHVEGDQILMEFNTSVSAAVISSVSATNAIEHTMLLMPIRLND